MLNIQRLFKSIANTLFGKRQKTEQVKQTVTHVEEKKAIKPRPMKIVRSNRKKTLGRRIYFQDIMNDGGKIIKSFRHKNNNDKHIPYRIPVTPTIEQEKVNKLKCYERWGVKEWNFGSETIYARNQKNAERKFRNLLAKEI